MNSNEALKRLRANAYCVRELPKSNWDGYYGNQGNLIENELGLEMAIDKDVEIISKDLERLNELDKENQNLKEKLKPYELWDEIKQDMVSSFEGICLYDFNIQYIRNSEKYFGTEMAVVRGTTLESLISGNRKLKKAMEIIDEKDIRVSSFKKVIQNTFPETKSILMCCFDLTEEEYNLLKEVLCDGEQDS